MSETGTPTQTPEAPVAQPETFPREYVEELRNEAAKARIEKKDAVAAVQADAERVLNEKLAEKDVEIAELKNAHEALALELEKLYVSLDAQIPSDKVRAFAALLKGDNADSIGESAKSAKELFSGLDVRSPAYDPSQGSGGSKVVGLAGDPILRLINQALGI